MFEEEHHGRAEPETGFEFVLRLHWVALGAIAALGAGGNAEWSRDSLLAFSLVGPLLLLANHFSGEGAGRGVVRRFLAWMLPCWVMLVVFAVGLAHPPYELVEDGSRKVWRLLELPGSAMPVSGGQLAVYIELFLGIGIYATALNATLVSEGRLVFARTWALLVLIAGAMALVGLIQHSMGTHDVLWIFPLQNRKFFSTFTHTAQWCAFALLWMSACLGLLAWLVRQRGWAWLSGDGWLLLSVAILIGATIFVAGEPLYQVLGAVVAGVGCIVIGWQTWCDRQKGKIAIVVAAIWAVIGLGLFGWGTNLATHQDSMSWIHYDGDHPGLPTHSLVIEDTQTMWLARPWFGWGHASYGVVFNFFQQTDEAPYYWAFARSDFWQSLAENGIIGTFVWWLPVLWMTLRTFWRRKFPSFLIAPLAGLVAVAALGLVDFPFNSPGVFYAWWLIFFSSARWSLVDEENVKSTPERRRIKELRSSGQTVIKPAPATPKPFPATPPAAGS